MVSWHFSEKNSGDMKVLVDLQSCQSGSRLGGIGRYSMDLLKAMISARPDYEFHVLLNGALGKTVDEVKDALKDYLPVNRIHIFSSLLEVSGYHKKHARTVAAEMLREKFIADFNPDVLHITSFIEGLGDDVVTSVHGLFPPERTVITLYDLIPLVEQDQYLGDDTSKEHYLNKIAQLSKAGVLLAISDFSRSEGVRLLDKDKHSIVNISSGVDSKFRKIGYSKGQISSVCLQYGIEKPFIMYTGSFDVRKNHGRLIQAFAKLPEPVRKKHQLVIVGNGWDGVYDKLRRVGKKAGLDAKDLIFTGRVDDYSLLVLYNSATLFVFPSLWEGFGLPVLEAMACGVPTIGSNTTSIREVVGLEEAMFDPESVENMASVMEKSLANADFRAFLVAHGEAHSKLFTWENSAETALEFIENVFKKEFSGERPIVAVGTPNKIFKKCASLDGYDDVLSNEVAYKFVLNDYCVNELNDGGVFARNIGWISTWNTKCGIAEYSKYLLRHFPIMPRVYAPIVESTTNKDENFVDRCWETAPGETLEFLEKGIERDSIEILVIQFNYGFFEFESLARLLRGMSTRNTSVILMLHSTVDPPAEFGNRKLCQIVEEMKSCARIFVHTLKDIERLNQIGLTDNVSLIPQGVYEPKNVLAQSGDGVSITGKRKQFGGDFTIATYGFFLPHKGGLEMLRAFKELAESRENLRLVMVNAEYPVKESSDLISEAKEYININRLENRVQLFTDYLKEDDSVSLLRHADLIVFPYQNTGESSSAAVRMGLASGRPVAVSPIPIFDDVGSVVFRLPGTNVADLAKGIADIIEEIESNTERSKDIARKASLWVKAHSYKGVAISLFDQIRFSAEKKLFDNDIFRKKGVRFG
jgi:glycosyltransferase involved in cell wall biosynthesis